MSEAVPIESILFPRTPKEQKELNSHFPSHLPCLCAGGIMDIQEEAKSSSPFVLATYVCNKCGAVAEERCGL